jgi:hypothetical protein
MDRNTSIFKGLKCMCVYIYIYKVKFILEHVTKDQRGIRGIRWGGWPPPRPLFTPRKETRYPFFLGVWVGPRAGLDGCEKYHLRRNSIPGTSRPVSESLYRLSYPGPYCVYTHTHIYRDRGSTVVKVLCYKSEGRRFDPSWCQWNFSLT